MGNTIHFKSQNKRSVIMIVASSLDMIIGHNNTIPWSCKEDMRFFRTSTTGHVVIMGRKTFESLNSKPLPNRINIVISSTLDINNEHDNVIIVRDMRSAIQAARIADLSSFNRNTEYEHIFIIGGLQIYKLAEKYLDEILHSTINVNVGQGIGTDLFETNPLIDNEVNEILYYNNVIWNTKDDSLREIVHYYKPEHDNKFKFKDKT